MRKNNELRKIRFFVIASMFLGFSLGVIAQNAVKDSDIQNDIMFQSFGWNEHEQSRSTSNGGFYTFYNWQASYLSEAGVDMVWFPPPSQSTGGVGYIPTKLNNFSETSYGKQAQLETMLDTYNGLQMYPIADVVVNHRTGTNGWTDFSEPTWGCEAICKNDDGGATASTASSGCTSAEMGANDEGQDFSAARDLDHTSTVVKQGVKDYLDLLLGLGFKGWRWDMVKGFNGSHVGDYNTHSSPYYSVGEYWDGNTTTLKTWIDATTKTSGVFDYANYYKLSPALKNGAYSDLNTGGKMPGVAGQYQYDDKAVTFVDNHDSFVKSDALIGDNVMKGYAYILTHPGIPCVFAPHYYGGSYTKDEDINGVSTPVTVTYVDNQESINKLMGVRKQNGINAYSSITIDQSTSYYAAYISANYGEDAVVAVRVGNDTWTPSGSDWILNESGTGYAVWSKKTITTPTIPTSMPMTVSLIGVGISDWSTDVNLETTDNVTYTLSNYTFPGGVVKFRANAGWDINWGSTAFPAGTGVQEGSNVTVPAGIYTVTFNRSTGAYVFTATNSIGENLLKNNVSVSPNPTTNSWLLSSDENILRYELFDVTGKLISQNRVNDTNLSIEGRDLNNGLYFVVFTTDNTIHTIKLIKK